MNLVPSFIGNILFTSFQQKNEIKRGKYPNEIQIFTFFHDQNYLFEVKINSPMFSALQYSFMYYEPRAFCYWRYLVYFISTEK